MLCLFMCTGRVLDFFTSHAVVALVEKTKKKLAKKRVGALSSKKLKVNMLVCRKQLQCRRFSFLRSVCDER